MKQTVISLVIIFNLIVCLLFSLFTRPGRCSNKIGVVVGYQTNIINNKNKKYMCFFEYEYYVTIF